MPDIPSTNPVIHDAQRCMRGLAIVAWSEARPLTAAAQWALAMGEPDPDAREPWDAPPDRLSTFDDTLALLDACYRRARCDRRQRERARTGYAMLVADTETEVDARFATALAAIGGIAVLWRLADRAAESLRQAEVVPHPLHLTDEAWDLIGSEAIVAAIADDTRRSAYGCATLFALTAAGACRHQWATWRAALLASLIMPAGDTCRDPLLLLLAGGLAEQGVSTSELHIIVENAPLYRDTELQPLIANHPAATTEVQQALGVALARAARAAHPRAVAATFIERCARILGADHPVTRAGVAAWESATN